MFNLGNLNYILWPNRLYYELIRISDSQIRPLIFMKFWNIPSKEDDFFRKKLFYSDIIYFRSKTINRSFQGLNLSGFILPHSSF